jgi:signal peptidase I
MAAARGKKKEEKQRGGSFETLKALAVAVVLALLIRSFVVEPFKIPSGSMIPTLLVGDYLVVSKFSYGIRLPITGQLLVPLGEPKRGDVIVFRYPDDPRQDFIKRVIGLPGDRIEFKRERLWVNGKLVDRVPEGEYSYTDFHKRGPVEANRYREINADGVEYTIIHNRTARVLRFSGPWIVPPGEYFMMGDNRDNSRDSREWKDKYVHADQIKGRAFMVHWSWVVDSSRTAGRGFVTDLLYTAYRVLTFQVEEIRWHRIGRSVGGVAD